VNEPAEYESKPVRVTACQWTGENWRELEKFVGPRCVKPLYRGNAVSLWVAKSKRWIMVPLMDWVIREPDHTGFYPCADAVFETRYRVQYDSDLRGSPAVSGS